MSNSSNIINNKMNKIRYSKSEKDINLFQNLYDHKYVKQVMTPLVKKRQIVASQIKPSSSTSEGNKFTGGGMRKVQSVDSLLPKLRQVEEIQRSDKRQNRKKKYLRKINIKEPAMSKLDIYFSANMVDKEKQNSLLFLTSQVKQKPVPDHILVDKFKQFIITQSETNIQKSLRALLNLSTFIDMSDEEKKELLGKRKSELETVIKKIIDDHHSESPVKKKSEKGTENEEDNLGSVDGLHEDFDGELQNIEFHVRKESSENCYNYNEKDIQWVISQCRKYDRKFKVKRLPQNSKPKGKKSSLKATNI